MTQWERITNQLEKIPNHRINWIRTIRNIKTMEVHRENRINFLSYNHKFVSRLSDQQINTVLVHEIEHLRRRHSQRCRWLVTLLNSKMIHELYKKAADLEINQNGIKCLHNGIRIGRGNYKSYQKRLSAEQYFICVLHDELWQRKKKK